MRISDWSSDVCSSDLRTGRCDVAEDVATALAQAREDALREAAGKCDEMARSAERSRAAAALAGRESVASRRQSDVETAEALRSEEHTSELQSLMRISYAVFCLQKKTQNYQHVFAD